MVSIFMRVIGLVTLLGDVFSLHLVSDTGLKEGAEKGPPLLEEFIECQCYFLPSLIEFTSKSCPGISCAKADC